MKIIFCVPGRNFSNNFLVSWTKLIKYCHEKNIHIELSNGYTSIVHLARYSCLGINPDSECNPCKNPFGGKVKYDYIMWIDSDMVFEPIHFEKLLEAKKEAITGLYKIQNTNIFACHKIETNESMTIEDVKNNIVPVSFSGMGFMLIKKGVFEKMEFPYFSIENTSMISETVSFCYNLEKAGIQLHAHTGVVLGHEKQLII